MTKYVIRYKTKGFDYTEVGGDVVPGQWRTLTARSGEQGVYDEGKADQLIEAFKGIGVKCKKVELNTASDNEANENLFKSCYICGVETRYKSRYNDNPCCGNCQR